MTLPEYLIVRDYSPHRHTPISCDGDGKRYYERMDYTEHHIKTPGIAARIASYYFHLDPPIFVIPFDRFDHA